MSRHQLSTNPTLQCIHIGKSYLSGSSHFNVLDQFSLALQPGEIGMLVGPSGCGKTTLLMIAGGITIPDNGTCKISGHDLFAMSSKQKIEFRKTHISFLFQHLHLFPALSALENLALPLLVDGVDYEVACSRAKVLMLRLGLEIHIYSKLDALSGGQKQRIAMGRALIRSSPLILCDEPTSNLDEESSHLVFSVIQEYAKHQKCTFLIVTHDHRIQRYADKILTFRGLNNYQVTYQVTPQIRHPERSEGSQSAYV